MSLNQRIYLGLSLLTSTVWISLGVTFFTLYNNDTSVDGFLYTISSFCCLGFSVPLLILLILGIKRKSIRKLIMLINLILAALLILNELTALFALPFAFLGAQITLETLIYNCVFGAISTIVINTLIGAHIGIALMARELNKSNT